MTNTIETTPEVTYGKFARGFTKWYQENFQTVRDLFTAESQAIFQTLEDFALEIYLSIIDGSMGLTVEPEPVEA